MKRFKYLCCLTLPLLFGALMLLSFLNDQKVSPHLVFPYKRAGLTEREAAAHLLSRFTYGAKPGEVDEVVNMGLERWFAQQLDGNLPDDSLDKRLNEYSDLKLSNTQIVRTFLNGGQVIRLAIKDGYINKDSVSKANLGKGAYKDTVAKYMQIMGYKPEQELIRQFINQKILRSAYTNNQLREVMTDFWFNHFNVSVTKNDCAKFIPAYERDVIRPNVFGKFSNLLLATAKSPAMLYYLDNFTSSGGNGAPQRPVADMMMATALKNRIKDSARVANMVKSIQKNRKTQGLNENYAREVMELHTLGVDGGYTQQDVTQAARVLTGWTIYPMDDQGYGGAVRKMIDRIGEDKLAEKGFVHDGDFLFAANRHDNDEKVVLGHQFPANGGYQEGVDLLEMLAHHPSAARFISRKLAVRFVSDNPPQSLINRMSKTFMEKDGDIRQVLITIVNSPEFWSNKALREKTKSPFELAINAVRSLNADITQPYQLFNWLNRMGERIYYYQAPTGFPDKGQYWINTGSLLNRMNFGLALAANRIPGVKVDLAALNNHHEPESAAAALVTYSKLIMPERDLDQTVKRLTPMLNDPQLVQKVADASKKVSPPQNISVNRDVSMQQDSSVKKINEVRKNNYLAMQAAQANNNMLSQVVGVIIGSPEFQRR